MDDLRFFQDLHGSSDHRWSSREGGGSCKGGALSALELTNRVENFNYGNEACFIGSIGSIHRRQA